MKTKKRFVHGFTLIELLVVISIIGILAGLSLVSFTTSQKQARDTQRKSDLKQYQTSLESFANTQEAFLFPSRTTAVDPSSLCTVLGIEGTCPTDPKSPSYQYNYISDGTGGSNNDATKYVLWANLESSSDYFVLCSNGQTGQTSTAPSSAACPL